MDMKQFNEYLIDLKSKDISEVIAQLKEELIKRKGMMTEIEMDRIVEYIKHMKSIGKETVEKSALTLDNVLKFYLEKL